MPLTVQMFKAKRKLFSQEILASMNVYGNLHSKRAKTTELKLLIKGLSSALKNGCPI